MSILLEQLTKRYDSHPVVNNVSLEIVDGEFFVLLGSSGSGKTTVLNMIAGLAGIDQARARCHPSADPGAQCGLCLPKLCALSTHERGRQY